MPTRRNEQETCSRPYPLTYRAEFDANHFIIYEGWSLKKSADTAAAEWLVCKHTYSSNDLVATNWASFDFDKIWDDRVTLVYT